MTGRFGKYGDAKRRLKMRKARRLGKADFQRASKKRPSKDTRPTRGRNS